MLAILAASPVVDVGSVLYFSELWWVGRKFRRSSSARVDREGSLVLPSWLAEAWLVKEAAAILLASIFHAYIYIARTLNECSCERPNA